MPTFAYVAKTRDGQRKSGTLTAENKQALLRSLQAQGLSPESVQDKAAKAAKGGGRKVKSTEILVFTRQLSTIVNAGLPLLQGLEIPAE